MNGKRRWSSNSPPSLLARAIAERDRAIGYADSVSRRIRRDASLLTLGCAIATACALPIVVEAPAWFAYPMFVLMVSMWVMVAVDWSLLIGILRVKRRYIAEVAVLMEQMEAVA